MSKAFQCSYEMAAHMERIGFPQLVSLGRQRRAKYIRQQQKVQAVLVADGMEENLPPCTDCPPGVFLFCQQTGTECQIFNLYVGKGQVVEHRCFLNILAHKTANPRLTKYCTEDTQIIKHQTQRRPYKKGRKPCEKSL